MTHCICEIYILSVKIQNLLHHREKDVRTSKCIIRRKDIYKKINYCSIYINPQSNKSRGKELQQFQKEKKKLPNCIAPSGRFQEENKICQEIEDKHIVDIIYKYLIIQDEVFHD